MEVLCEGRHFAWAKVALLQWVFAGEGVKTAEAGGSHRVIVRRKDFPHVHNSPLKGIGVRDISIGDFYAMPVFNSLSIFDFSRWICLTYI